VRLRRKMLGLSQEKLAASLGLTFQQVQKYERGFNRIGASRLHELSQVLNVPVSFFFDDTDPVRAPAIPDPVPEVVDGDLLRDPQAVELVGAYYRIASPETRRTLVGLLKELSGDVAKKPRKPRVPYVTRGRPTR